MPYKLRKLTLLALLIAGGVQAAMIVPPSDLAELARTSRAVVLAQAVDAWSTPGPYVPHTVTRFQRVELVAGEDPGDSFQVSVPGGEVDGVAAVVAGAPYFQSGAQYLLFLGAGRDGYWRVRMMAYGVFEKLTVGETVVLAPVPEREEVGLVRRFDVEVPGVYRARALLDSLRSVVKGESTWDSGKVLAPPETAAEIEQKSAPSACQFMTYSGNGIRWFGFDTGSQATIRATTPGQTGISDGGVGAVSGAAAAWTNDPGSLINLQYGGTIAQSISCSGTDTHFQDGAVVFDDPCGDIDPLSSCSGTLAYGGPRFYTSTQSFDGQQWNPAISLFVVVNDGSECVGETNFSEFMTHEIGHGLGFGHHTDSDATMYYLCCHYPRGAGLGATDSACAAYLYPDSSSSPPPNAPTGLTATAVSETRIDLSWADTSSDETGFKIYRSTGGSYQLVGTVGANTSTFSDTTLSACTTASYYVTAFNDDGESSDSNVASDETSGEAPQAPSSFAAQAPDSSRVILTWSNGSVSQSSVFVERAVGSGSYCAWATLGGTATTYQDSAVQAGTEYRYRLKASNACGSSAYSQEVSVTVPSEPMPTAPAGLTATAVSETRIDLSWTDTSSDETGFRVYRSTGGSYQLVGTVGANTSTFSDTTLSPCTTASYYVTAFNANGESSASNVASGETSGQAPQAPSSLAAQAPDSNQVVLTWSNGSVSQSSVFVERAVGSGSFSARATLGGTATTYQDSAVQAGTEYRYRLRSLNVCGYSAYSQEASVTVPSDDGPLTVDFSWSPTGPWVEEDVNFTASAGGQPDSLSWDLGDGTTATGGTVAHRYAGPGTYVVRLTASRAEDSTTVTKIVTVEAAPELVAASARTSGFYGTSWRTDAVLLNAGSSVVTGQLILRGGDGSQLGSLQYDLDPRQMVSIEDVVGSMGLTGTGSLVVEPTHGVAPVIMTRTYTGDENGTYGQAIPPQTPAHSGTQIITGLRGSPGFRTNFGVASASSSPVQVSLTLHTSSGTTKGPTLTVTPFQQAQWPLESLFGSPVLSGVSAGTLEVSCSGPVAAYASVVDDDSGDPVFLPGETPAASWVVPVVGRGAGKNETWWDTELVLYNAGGDSASVDLEYLPANVGNAAGGDVAHIVLGSGETRRIEHAQSFLWGVSKGLGSVVVTASRPLVAVARIATACPEGSGSMGQRIPAFRADLISEGQSVLPWVRWDQDFRTNIGLWNGSSTTRSVTLELHSIDGSVAATTLLTVPPRSLVQLSQEDLFGSGGGVSSGWIRVVGTPDKLVLYSSQVDNSTGDPVYVSGE